MAINYAEKYSDQVDERFKLGAVTTPAINTEYDWTGVNTVNVYSIPTVEMGDYSMSGSNRYGTPSELENTVQTMSLSQDRAFTFTIDRRNYDDTMMTTEAGKALARQIDEVIIPEIDIYRLAKMAANAGTTATAAVTKENAYSVFLDATAALTEKKVPIPSRVAYVTPNYYKLIKQDDAFIKKGDMAQQIALKGQVGEIDGVPIIVIPSSYLPENVEFMLTSSIATVSPTKLFDFKTHDNPPGINGWLVEGRVYYDAFVLNNKKNAIYVHTSA